MDPYHIEKITQLDKLASIAGKWNDLVERCPYVLPTSSYAWVSSFFEHRLKKGEEWVCYVALNGDELAGVLPLVVTTFGGSFSNRRMLRLPVDHHAVSVDLVLRADDASAVAGILVKRVFSDFPRIWSIDFSRIPDHSPTLSWLKSNPKVPVHTIEFDGRGAYLLTHGDYEEFSSGFSSKFRKNLRYYSNKLAELDGYSRLTVSGNDASPDFLEPFMAVENANWKGQGGSSIQNSESLRVFYRKLVHRLHESGWLRWDFIKAGGKTIAGSISVCIRNRMTIWKIAYDEEYAKLSAGTIILNDVIHSSFENPNLERVELLSDYQFVSKWRVEWAHFYNVRVYRRSLAVWIFHFVPKFLKIQVARVPLLMAARKRIQQLIGL